VPAGPQGEPVSRLGDADRDRLAGVLREHYALGRLDDAEQDLPPLAGGAGAGSAPGQGRSGRRHAQTAAPGAAWVPTAERFRDPSSGTIMRVWLDPADDSRHYVPDGDGA
jgi:hypothetical protein